MSDNGVRTLVCQCGCNKTFTQSRVGRVRKYLNNTHKSDANNKRTAQLVKRGKSLGDAKLLCLIIDDMETEDIAAWYPDLSTEQWVVIDAMRNTTLQCHVFLQVLSEMAAW